MIVKRTKNAKRNMAVGLFFKSMTMFLSFATRTVLIKKLGMEYIGLDSLFASVLQVLSLADLGFGQAAVFSLYKPIADDDTVKIKALLNYYKKAYFVAGTVIIAIGIVIYPFIDCFVFDDIPNGINLKTLYIINLLNISLSYVAWGYKQVLFSSMQRMDIINGMVSLSRILMYVCQILVLLWKANYYVYAVLIPITTVIGNLMIALYTDSAFSKYIPEGILDKESRKMITQQLKGLLIGKLCGVSRNSFDSIYITAFLGLSVTGVYSNYYLIINTLNALTIIFLDSIVAGIGNSMVVETKNKNYDDFSKLDFLYMWIAGLTSITMFCAYKPFMELWAGKKFVFSSGVTFLFSLYYYIQKMGDIRYVYSEAAGLWWENRGRNIAEAIMNLILNYLLIQWLGVAGIVIATIVTVFVFGWVLSGQVLYKCFWKDFSIKDYYCSHLKYAAVTFATGVVIVLITRGTTTNIAIIDLPVNMVLCLIIPSIIYYIVYGKTKIFHDSIEWVSTRVGIRK